MTGQLVVVPATWSDVVRFTGANHRTHKNPPARTCVVDAQNANSMLYGAAWRATRALGWRRLVTYTQAGESGASLRAAGWRVVAERKPRPGWNMPGRPRKLRGVENVARTLWEAS